MQNNLILPESLLQLAAHNKIYVVGGYVRNHLCNLGQTDIDLCGPCKPTDLVLPSSAKMVFVHAQLGTVVIKIDNDTYQYTPFRTEQYMGGSHKPYSVQFVQDIQKDCIRRDFACNAVYYDIAKGQFVDPVGGINDCKNSILRQIHDSVFKSDGLRVLRMIRIASEMGFEVEDTTKNNAIDNEHLLDDISIDRKRQELTHMLYADRKYGVQFAHHCAVRMLLDTGVARRFGIQNNKHALGVFRHCSHRIRQYCFVMLSDCVQDTLMRMGIVGRTAQETVRFAKAVGQFVGDVTVRLCIEYMDILDNIVEYYLAYTASGTSDAARVASHIKNTVQRIKDTGIPIHVSQLAINGNDLNFVNPKDIGNTLNILWQHCIDNPHDNNRERLLELSR